MLETSVVRLLQFALLLVVCFRYDIWAGVLTGLAYILGASYMIADERDKRKR